MGCEVFLVEYVLCPESAESSDHVLFRNGRRIRTPMLGWIRVGLCSLDTEGDGLDRPSPPAALPPPVDHHLVEKSLARSAHVEQTRTAEDATTSRRRKKSYECTSTVPRIAGTSASPKPFANRCESESVRSTKGRWLDPLTRLHTPSDEVAHRPPFPYALGTQVVSFVYIPVFILIESTLNTLKLTNQHTRFLVLISPTRMGVTFPLTTQLHTMLVYSLSVATDTETKISWSMKYTGFSHLFCAVFSLFLLNYRFQQEPKDVPSRALRRLNKDDGRVRSPLVDGKHSVYYGGHRKQHKMLDEVPNVYESGGKNRKIKTIISRYTLRGVIEHLLTISGNRNDEILFRTLIGVILSSYGYAQCILCFCCCLWLLFRLLISCNMKIGLVYVELALTKICGRSSIGDSRRGNRIFKYKLSLTRVSYILYKISKILLFLKENLPVLVLVLVMSGRDNRRNKRRGGGKDDKNKRPTGETEERESEHEVKYKFDISDLDNFFPYVEFCDSGDSEEEAADKNKNTQNHSTSTNQIQNEVAPNQEEDELLSKPSTTTSTIKIKPALCIPSDLSPPPILDSKPTFKKPVGRAKIAKPIRTGQGRVTREGGLFLKKGESQPPEEDRQPEETPGVEDNEVENDEPEESVSAGHESDEEKIDDKPEGDPRTGDESDGIKVGEGEFSITSLIADIDERDFEDSGPLLNSTMDRGSGNESEMSNASSLILRGENSREARSLKDSFKKKADPEMKKKKANDERKAKRGEKYNEGREMGGIDSEEDEERGWSRSRSRSPINNLSNKSNTEPRRGISNTNWADISFGSVLSCAGSDRTLSGPRRKTRRGRRKRKSFSGSQTDVSLSESFRASLQGTRRRGEEDESFDMDQSQDKQFSGTFKGGRNNGQIPDYAASPILDSRQNRKTKEMVAARRTINKDLGSNINEVNEYSGGNNNNNILSVPFIPKTTTGKKIIGCPVLEKIANVVGKNNPFGDQDDGDLDLNDSRVQLLEQDYVNQKHPADGEKQLLDKTQEIETNLLLPISCDVSKVPRKIKTKGIIQFVIMRRPKDGEDDEEWQIFDRKTLEGLINSIESNNARAGNGLSDAFRYANMWGKVPVIGLYSSSLEMMNAYRHQIELYSKNDFVYQTFPRQVLNRRLALTMMLWQNLEGVETDAIAANLLDRNRRLTGGVRVAKCKTFKVSDLDTRGQSMLGARLVQLDTDETFLRSLSKFPKSYRFGLGVGTVIIRGGDRASEPPGSTWGQNRTSKPKSYSEAAGANAVFDDEDLNISGEVIQVLAEQDGKVMEEAERSVRGRRNHTNKF